MTGYIYKITNLINQKAYIGKTVNSIEKRWSEHQREAQRERAENRPLYKALNKYGISKTSLKNCFKEVYGKPIFTWRKEYRLDYSCKLINEDKYNISQIANMVGYKSPSKFTKAFKEYIGCTPSEYRKI